MSRQLKESSLSIIAYQMYLTMAPPRNLAHLAGECPVGPDGKKGRPLNYDSLRRWSATFNWRARAEAFDLQAAELQRQAVLEHRRNEAIRREERRLRAADVQMDMALEYLTWPEQHQAEEVRGKPRPLEDLDVQKMGLAARFIQQAAETERLELGLATSRHESLGSPGQENGAGPGQVVVIAEPGLGQLRDVVASLTRVAPPTPAHRQLERIIDADSVVEQGE